MSELTKIQTSILKTEEDEQKYIEEVKLSSEDIVNHYPYPVEE